MGTTTIQAKPLPDPLPTRVNLGCGWDVREGWLNIDLFDFHHADLVADITDLPMLPDGAFQEILAQDVLEHLPRAKTGPALKEWARLLAPGGTITLRVPSLPDAAAMLSRPERQSAEKADEIIHLIYGTQAYGGDFHLSGYTFRTLAHHLAQAGMLLCEARLRDECLIEATARKATVLQSVQERVHNRFVHILGRPADPGGLAGISMAVTEGNLADADVDAILSGSEEALSLRQHSASPCLGPIPAVSNLPGAMPHDLARAELVFDRNRPMDLLRALQSRIRRILTR